MLNIDLSRSWRARYRAVVLHFTLELSVTKRNDERKDYIAFIKRAGVNDIGRRVKIADLKDNMNMSRIAAPTERDYERIAKYEEALAYLQEG